MDTRDYSCHNGMCGGCPSCLSLQGYVLPKVALIEKSDFVGVYSLADLMIELYLNNK